jgi:uncharacterized protein YeaO (DUF488 family)
VGVVVKRIYDEPDPADGFRVRVDRLWPRGVTKERAALALWLKDIAPSTELRTWFHAHPDGFDEFAKPYRAELDTNPAVGRLREIEAREPRVTLLYSVAIRYTTTPRCWPPSCPGSTPDRPPLDRGLDSHRPPLDRGLSF